MTREEMIQARDKVIQMLIDSGKDYDSARFEVMMMDRGEMLAMAADQPQGEKSAETIEFHAQAATVEMLEHEPVEKFNANEWEGERGYI